MSPAEQARRRAPGLEAPRGKAAARPAPARQPRLLLIEPSDSALVASIARAAAQAGLAVEPLHLPLHELPASPLVGIGPSVLDPLQVAREVRQLARNAILVFFVASQTSSDALHAQLIRDPFVCDRFELIEVTDDRRQLASRIAQADGRADRQHGRSPGPGQRSQRRTRVSAAPSPVSDRFLAAILAQASDAIFSTDARGRLLTWNDGAEHLLGFTPEAAIGQPLRLLNGGDEGELSDLGVQVLAKREPAESAVTCQHADGRSVAVSVRVAPIHDGAGHLLGLSIIARDNAAQVRAEEALRDANRQKDEFLAIMSHELRTPLTSILGYTDMLMRGLGGDLAPRSTRYVGNVRAAGDRLLELVNGLLDYTRLEAGAERLDMRPTGLGDLVSKVAERYQEQAAAKRIDLLVDVGAAESALQVCGDADKLQHVLRSYVGNALKFTPEGGRIQVRFGRDPDDAGMVRVAVSDSGIGLRDEQLARVWERFYQGDLTLTRPYGGMGLGLSIARHLVQLHGGHVGAQSSGPDLGSTFWFNLPAI